MKLWKRFALLALLAGVLGGSALTGCSKGGDDDSATNAADNGATKDKDKTPKDADEGG